MPLILGKNSYCHTYNESGDVGNLETVVGNYTGINSISIFACFSTGLFVGEISHFPFGWHAQHLTDVELFQTISRERNSKIRRKTCIGNDVWIGANVTIKLGLTIGDGAIVAYNSNVTKDVPPYCVVGGNPARIIRKRYTDDIIEKLLKIKWWDWEDEKIQENRYLFINGSINDFVNKFS